MLSKFVKISRLIMFMNVDNDEDNISMLLLLLLLMGEGLRNDNVDDKDVWLLMLLDKVSGKVEKGKVGAGVEVVDVFSMLLK